MPRGGVEWVGSSVLPLHGASVAVAADENAYRFDRQHGVHAAARPQFFTKRLRLKYRPPPPLSQTIRREPVQTPGIATEGAPKVVMGAHESVAGS